MGESKNGLLLCNDKSDGKEKIRVLLIFILIPQIQLQDPFPKGRDRMQA